MEIKFRIWNGLGKNMLYDVENVYECLMQQIRFDKSQPSKYNKINWDHRSEGMVWMQYIGLNYGDGKCIYESDVFYIDEMQSGNKVRVYGFIVFKEAKFQIEWVTPTFMNNSIHVRNMEMVFAGTTFENPELLKNG